MDGPWNSGKQWELIDGLETARAMDSGDGTASVKLDKDSAAVAMTLAARTRSNPARDPATGPRAGRGHGQRLRQGWREDHHGSCRKGRCHLAWQVADGRSRLAGWQPDIQVAPNGAVRPLRWRAFNPVAATRPGHRLLRDS